MAFDIEGARKAGYSDAEIADYLGQQNKFDVAGARKAGYSDAEIIGHLGAPPVAPAEPGLSEKIANATRGYIDPAAIGHALKGEADIAATGALNVPHAALSALTDLFHRATGNADAPMPDWINAIHAQLGQSGKDFVQNAGQVAKDTGLADAAQKYIAEPIQNDDSLRGDLVRSGLHVAGDVLSALPGAALAESAGKSTASAMASGAVRNAAADTAATEAGFRNASGAAGKFGQMLADDTTKPALVNHNADIAAVHARAESNIPQGTALSEEAFNAGREAPNAVFNRAAKALPTSSLDQDAVSAINSAGQPEGGRITKGSPQAQAQIEELRARLTDPEAKFTGQQQVNELRGLRQEGYANIGSEDVSNQQLGKAQLDMARAIEGHIQRNLPANSDVSWEQFLDARKALAKSHTWQAATRGSDVDLNALARVQRADPGILDGPTKVAADFANNNREVVGLPTRLNAPNVVKDVKDINILHPIGSTVQALGGSVGRQLLRGGSTAATVERLGRLFPNNPGRFAPLEPKPPQAPDWTTSPGAGGPAPAGPGGDISLADLLSHGVEQTASPGLSLSPMGAPPSSGIPFVRNAAHEAGDLSLAQEQPRSLGDLLSDLAAVQSQGVPEGTMARTPTQPSMRLGDVLSMEGGPPADLKMQEGPAYTPHQHELPLPKAKKRRG